MPAALIAIGKTLLFSVLLNKKVIFKLIMLGVSTLVKNTKTTVDDEGYKIVKEALEPHI